MVEDAWKNIAWGEGDVEGHSPKMNCDHDYCKDMNDFLNKMQYMSLNNPNGNITVQDLTNFAMVMMSYVGVLHAEIEELKGNVK